MEIEYVDCGKGQPEENFILPQTEKTINQIIDEFTYFFSVCRFLLQVVYIVYLVLRFIYLDHYKPSWCLSDSVCFSFGKRKAAEENQRKDSKTGQACKKTCIICRCSDCCP